MNAYTIFHNPRCSKSRQTLRLLHENGIEPNIRLYLETPLAVQEIQHICELLKVSPQEIVRRKEDLFKELSLGEKNLSDEELCEILSKYPKLLERPIVVKNNTEAVLGRPPENVQRLL